MNQSLENQLFERLKIKRDQSGIKGSFIEDNIPYMVKIYVGDFYVEIELSTKIECPANKHKLQLLNENSMYRYKLNDNNLIVSTKGFITTKPTLKYLETLIKLLINELQFAKYTMENEYVGAKKVY